MYSNDKVGDVRHVFIVISLLSLAGCPPVQRLYIHNKSDNTIYSAYLNPNWDEVRIRPGATKWISLQMGMVESCFSVSLDESTKAFSLPRTILVDSKSTGYGSRLDVNYEYGQFHFRRDDSEWVQLEEVAACGDVQ
jgi:hypothetical protein